MARTIDTIVREMLGGQAVQLAALTAQVEDLSEKLAAAEAKLPKQRAKKEAE